MAVRTYSRRFVALVIDLPDRYHFDPFFRTEVHVIALQIAFATVILVLVGTSFSFLYHDVSLAITAGIRASAVTGNSGLLAPAIVQEIQQIRSQNLLAILGIIIITTTFFGYLIARTTLRPTRNALAAQKQFIGNIAHELRTPLSVIRTNTEIALFEINIPSEVEEMLRSNVEEIDRISEIINNLLSLSTLIRPGRMEFANVDLHKIAADTIEKYAPLAKKNKLRVTLRKASSGLVWGNTIALEQIVGNLLKNALNYTPPDGHVMVTIEPTVDGLVELSIKDSGIGISRKDLFRIFEPFYRAEPSRTRAQGSSGLGLTIVSELLKLHQGKIAIRSAMGRGTTVTILIPQAHKHQSAAKKNPNDEHAELDEIAVDFSNKDTS